MALRFAETRAGLLPFLARICVVGAALMVLTTQAQARYWRQQDYDGYRPYIGYHPHAAYRAAPARAHVAAAHNPAFAAIVVDENSGRTLYAASENELRHPASLTKVMTLYLLFEQLEKGRLSLESPIPMSAHAASQAPSKLGLEPGETISVENAIKAIVTRSANDVAVAVAEAIGGDEESFAQMMTRKARALGMEHTTYVNASGLPDDRQITTAHDLTLLGRAVEERFPRYFRYFSTQAFEFGGETIGNHNHLLGRVDGVDGIKTGYTRASGFNLLTSVHRGGRSLVAVVMGGPTAGARDRFMESLIAEHIASATTIRGATMIAEATTTAPPPAPPVRSAAIVAAADVSPIPPVRALVAQSSNEDAEGDSDNVERDAPAPAPEAVRHLIKLETRVAAPLPVLPVVAPLPPAAPTRVADASPAPAGAFKGADSAAPKAAPKASLPIVALAAPAPPPPVRKAETNPAALGWVRGPDGVARSDDPKAELAIKALAAAMRAREETPVARSVDARPSGHDGWMIQIGASEDAGKANDLLIRAKTQNRSILASARPFTEKIEKANGAFYRARFAGLDSSSTAETACKNLKRNGFSCFATHD